MMCCNRRSLRALLAPLMAALLLAGLIVTHAYVRSQGDGYAGPLLVLDHLFSVLGVLTLLALCAAVGRFALSRSGLLLGDPLEALPFATAIGGGILGTTLVVSGFLSGLGLPILALFLLTFALLARRELLELPRLLAGALATLRSQAGALPLTIISVVALLMIAQAVAPPSDYDSLMYHVRVPDQFLRAGQIYLPEDNLHAAFIGLVHILYLPLIAFVGPAAPALLNTFLALMLGLAVFAFGVRFLGRGVAGFSSAILWGSTILLFVAVTPKVDVTLAFYLFLAHYALIAALSDASNRKYFYLGAVLLGLGVGIKYFAFPYILALSPLILWAGFVQSRGEVGPAFRLVTVFAVLGGAAALPWLLKNVILFGSPVYPLFAERILEPWLAVLYGGQTVPPTINPEIFDALGRSRVAFNLRDFILAPGRLTAEAEGVLYYPNPILFFLPLSLLFVRNKAVGWLLIPAVLYASIVVLPYQYINLRYLIPVIAPLTVAAAFAVERISSRLVSPARTGVILAAVTTLALFPSGFATYVRLTSANALSFAAGVSSRRDYLHGSPELLFHSKVTELVNQNAPAESRILMIFEGRGYYFDRTVIQDNVLTNWPLAAPKATSPDCLGSVGVTHVLVGSSTLRYFMQRGLDPKVLGWDLFPEFAERCLMPVYEGPAYSIFQVAPQQND